MGISQTFPIPHFREQRSERRQLISLKSAAKTALEAQAATLADRIGAMDTPCDRNAADVLIKENIRRCTEILRSPEADMPAKHRAVHAIIEKCLYDKSANSLQVFYRLTLPES